MPNFTSLLIPWRFRDRLYSRPENLFCQAGPALSIPKVPMAVYLLLVRLLLVHLFAGLSFAERDRLSFKRRGRSRLLGVSQPIPILSHRQR
ncbi:MAG: hypothetical protein F6J93_14820 [Oscillatoria sp. SIO1A7]|nr:hypothetical protein [Oscillatoria sp. SIO1A7]